VKASLAAFGAGALFGLGLAISGMTKPAKVVGFLDVFGDWDPSLAFVMMGAVLVHFVAHRIVTRRTSPLLAPRFDLPSNRTVDARLLAGAAVFGIGWGVGGYCPGPALVTAASGASAALVFVAAMTAGIKLEHAIAAAVARSRQA